MLIPKIQGPETLRNYIPISLCNTVYKIVTKIIVARLRPYLEKLVSPLQMAFVLGRKGIDNVVIVQEPIHSISKKMGGIGYIVVKIDMEKVYDKLEWSFIRKVLVKVNLPQNLRDLIMSCVSSSFSSILFNGGCMEYLGQLIEEKCGQKLWIPAKTSQGGIAFSHLMFADDIILFPKADQINCLTIREVLDEFCSKTRQTISVDKSQVFFSPNVDRDAKESLCEILVFASTPNIGKYLGIPIKHPGSSSLDYNFILDRVKNNLAGWKANLLSPTSQVVLIQASFSTIPAYVMQCGLLPNRILEGIERVNRKFLWDSTESASKVHWVGWGKVTQPKVERGLRMKSAKGRNIAMLTKLKWRFHLENESLWARDLNAKYCLNHRLNSRNPSSLPRTQIWRGMNKGADLFQQGVRWVIGNQKWLPQAASSRPSA